MKQELMQVTVVSAIGGSRDLLNVEKGTLVKELKMRVAEKNKIPVQMVIMVAGGMQLDDQMTLEEAGVEELDTLYLITRTEGGYASLVNIHQALADRR